jgi:hypothetical protein
MIGFSFFVSVATLPPGPPSPRPEITVVSLTGAILFSIAIHLCEVHHIQAVTKVIPSSRLLGLCLALMTGARITER